VSVTAFNYGGNGSPYAAEGSESKLKEYFFLLLRGKWIILATTLAMTGVMVLYTLETKPVYEASALVLVNPRTPTPGVGQEVSSEATNSPSRIANEIAILKTVAISESAAAALLKNPYIDEGKKELIPVVAAMPRDTITEESLRRTANRLRKAASFSPERESDVIRISAKSGDPREAAIIANTFAEAYQEHTMIASRSRSRSIREFLENRLTEQRAQLRDAESSVRGFMEETGVVSLDAESNKITSELAELEAKRNALDVDIESEQQKYNDLEKQFPQNEGALADAISQANDPYIRLLQEQLAKMEVQRDVIVAQNDPAILGQVMYREKLAELESQIQTLRQNLQSRSNDFIKTFGPGSEARTQSDPLNYLRNLKERMLETKFLIESLKSKRGALQAIINQYESRFREIPNQSIEFARLQRERLSTEKLYSMVEEKFNEAAITEKSEFGHVHIVDRALIPGGPVSPNPTRNLLMGIVLGFGIGLTIVVVRDFLDVRVRTPEQLKRRGFMSLAEIGPMEEELRLMEKDSRIPHDVQRLDRHLWLIFDPLSYLAESYRRLRTNLLRLQLEHPLKVIAVTSPNPGEGKSTTICNLGITLTESQQRVLLVDADLRRPTVHSAFSLPAEPGLTDVLSGKLPLEKVLHRDVLENLDVLTCGGTSFSPSRVVGSRDLRQFLDQARQRYSWILLDAPPILVVNDSAMLSMMVDGLIITVASGHTRFAALERAVEFVQSAGGRTLGFVLNKFNAKKEYGGYYGSFRYGHYASKHEYYTAPAAQGPAAAQQNKEERSRGKDR
jgi:capsular exopolysaccharide synthesis family protein